MVPHKSGLDQTDNFIWKVHVAEIYLNSLFLEIRTALSMETPRLLIGLVSQAETFADVSPAALVDCLTKVRQIFSAHVTGSFLGCRLGLSDTYAFCFLRISCKACLMYGVWIRSAGFSRYPLIPVERLGLGHPQILTHALLLDRQLIY